MEHVKHATSTRAHYVGPTAARIAELIAPLQRVRFERGWFWTAAACHRSEEDLTAFRQRPDGDGIDVRCKSAGCSRERVIRSLEQLAGESIWSAYTTEPRASRPRPAPVEQIGKTDASRSRPWGLALGPFIVVLAAAPLVVGADLPVVGLNAVGLVWSTWLGRRVLLNRRRALAKGGRQS